MTMRWLAVLGVLLLASQVSAGDQAVLKTQQDKVSYGIGVSVGKNLKRQGIEVNPDLLVKGLKDELSGSKLLMTEPEMAETMKKFQMELRQKMMEARKKAAADNKKEGEAFLAANKKKEGVVTLPSGLQYKILKKGEGKKPKENDTVQVNYRGTLINGTEFDSSKRTGKPVTLKLNAVIPGWREALTRMPLGSKWQLFIPPKLAYGERGAGRVIGPDATLIFEVELLAIQPPKAKMPQGKGKAR